MKNAIGFIDGVHAWLGRQDPRYLQIFGQSSFLIFGLIFLQWEERTLDFALTFAGCLTFQHLFQSRFGGSKGSWKSALISSLSLCLMFNASAWWALVLCTFLTIGGKFLIRYEGRHIFNPTNFGIIITILLTGEGWISPGRWGSALYFLILISALGLGVLFRVGRLETALSFLSTFALLHFLRSVVFLGWPADFFLHQLSSGTLLVFTFFMITDPVTTPRHPLARVIWAGLTGVLAFVLSSQLYIHTAPLWALFFMSPLTILFNRLFTHSRFSWA